MSPTQRSLKFLREHGWTAQVVERWNQFAQIRQDVFGFIDIIAVHPDHPGVLAIQATTYANRLARLEKICEEPRAEIWIQAKNRIEIHGWKKTPGRWELVTVRVGPRK